MRELASVIKNRFFVNLLGAYDLREFFTRSMISLRFKLNNSPLTDFDSLLFHSFGMTNASLNKIVSLGETSVTSLNIIRHGLIKKSDYFMLFEKAHVINIFILYPKVFLLPSFRRYSSVV
jgi:hypothetical protein